MDLPEKTLEILHIDEPPLEFGHGQISDHPKDGLFYMAHTKDRPPPAISLSV